MREASVEGADEQDVSGQEMPYLISDALRQRLDLAHHLLEFGRQIIAIAGDPGSGRSSFLAQIAQDAGANWKLLALSGQSFESTAGFLQSLHQMLARGTVAAAISNPLNLEDLIRDQLRQLHFEKRLCVLVLDDADRLDRDLCELLFRLAHRDDEIAELRVLLTVRREARVLDHLQTCAPHAALLHLIDIPPMTIPQVEDFADVWCSGQRLDRRQLSRSAGDELARESHGNPGKLLALLSARSRHPVESAPPLPLRLSLRKPQWIVIAALLLSALLLGGVMLARDSNRERPSLRPAVEIELPQEAPAERTSEDPRGSEPAPDSSGPANALTTPPLEPSPALDFAAEAIEESVPRDGDIETGVSEANSAQQYSALIPSGPPLSEALGAEAGPAENSPPGTIGGSEPKAATRSAASADVSAYTPNWIEGQADNTFVVQLIGLREERSAEKFLAEHGLSGKAAILPLSLGQGPWFIVVTGHYQTRAEATAGIAELPSALRVLKPWPRAIGSLKNR